jgi:hypothetical protein
MEPPAASTRWLLAAAAILAAIVALGLLVGQDPDGPELDTDDPAATVRDFLLAVEDRDVEGLRTSLAAEHREACDADELWRATRGQRHRDVRATLVEVRELDGEAEVEVRRTEHRGEPPFGGGGHSRTEVFELTRERGAWVVTHVPWSYTHLCPEWSR